MSDLVLKSLSKCIEDVSSDSTFASFQDAKQSMREKLNDLEFMDNYIIDEFMEYLDKMARTIVDASGANYEN